MLRPSYVDDHIRKVYSDLAKTLEIGGAQVLNSLDESWEKHLQVTYEKDLKTLNTIPSFDTYCLLRNLMSISTSDCLLTPSRRITASEIAQYNVARAAGLFIKEIEL